MLAIRTRQTWGQNEDTAFSSKPHSLIAGASTNATLVKAAPGVITALVAINQNAALRWLKFYDMAQVPVAGNGTPVRRFAIPAATTGAGLVLCPLAPMEFKVGIAYTITGGQADNDATNLTAGDIVLTFDWI